MRQVLPLLEKRHYLHSHLLHHLQVHQHRLLAHLLHLQDRQALRQGLQHLLQAHQRRRLAHLLNLQVSQALRQGLRPVRHRVHQQVPLQDHQRDPRLAAHRLQSKCRKNQICEGAS